jgi:hypothetical protein
MEYCQRQFLNYHDKNLISSLHHHPRHRFAHYRPHYATTAVPTKTNMSTYQQQQQQQHHHHFLLQQIECNRLPILELTKEVEEIFAGIEDLRYDDITILLEALEGNESIHCVQFEGDFLDCLHPLRRSELLRAVGTSLRNLYHLGLGDSPMFVADLCHLVTESKSLRSLHLHDSILQGTTEDFRAFEEVLRSHPSIQELEIHECTSAICGTNIKALRNALTQRRRPTTSFHQRSSRSRKLFVVAKRRGNETKM